MIAVVQLCPPNDNSAMRVILMLTGHFANKPTCGQSNGMVILQMYHLVGS